MGGENWKGSGDWSPVYIGLWVVWVATFFILELWALFDKSDKTPTLTEVVTRWFPGWALFAVLGWLFWHFIASKNQHELLGQEEEKADTSTDG